MMQFSGTSVCKISAEIKAESVFLILIKRLLNHVLRLGSGSCASWI